MKSIALEHHRRLPKLTTLGKKVLIATVLGAMWIFVAATTCHAMQFQYGVDDNLQQVGPNAWHFTVDLGVKPVGRLQFVGSEFDFTGLTQGFAVSYDFDSKHGRGCSDPRSFMLIAPTLFDPINGFLNDWDASDLKDGTFSGVIYATAPPTAVYLVVEAEGFARVRGAHRPH